jgi:arylsulfatase A-like enzyme
VFVLAAMVHLTTGIAAGRPDIVFILADDLGYGDVACFNPQSRIPTPHIDGLAREGMRFTDAHSASAVCTPTRYGLLTGRYCWRTRLKSGVLGGFSKPLIDPRTPTVAAFLKERGYATAAFGKWHLGMDLAAATTAGLPDKPDAGEATDPLDRFDYAAPIKNGPVHRGFDRFFGISASLDMPPFIFVDDDRFVGRATVRKRWLRTGPAEPSFEAGLVVDAITKRAASFIRAQRGSSAPMFVYLALTAPHTPIVPRGEFIGRSQAGLYGDFVAETDWAVGEILAALKDVGRETSSLVIFTSDNGASPGAQGDRPSLPAAKNGHESNRPWRGAKSDIHEGGHRVPLVARWPGRTPAGSACHDPVCLNFLFATCAALMGESVPAGAAPDSFSIAPWIEGGKPDKPTHPSIVHHSINGLFALRQGPWKFIDGKGSGGWSAGDDGKPAQLFNLDDDPAESRNRIDDEPERAARMKAELAAVIGRVEPANPEPRADQ